MPRRPEARPRAAERPIEENPVPFAHCIACGSSAMIDPSGRCPEGHVVGAAGARVTAAIGSSTPHPDEPVPWVGVVDLHPAPADEEPAAPRVARPPSVAPDPTQPLVETGTAEDLFRELQALGDLSDLGGSDTPDDRTPLAPAPSPLAPAPRAPAPSAAAPAPVPPTPAPARLASVASIASVSSPPAPADDDLFAAPTAAIPVIPPPPVAPPAALAVTPGSPTPPSSPDDATDLDELASLVAAIESLDDRGATTVEDGPTPEVPSVPTVLDPVVPPAPARPNVTAFPSPPDLWATPPTPATPPPLATDDGPDAVHEPADVPEDTAEIQLAAAGASLFDGSFTARGNAPGRRAQRRLEDKTAKRSLFRR